MIVKQRAPSIGAGIVIGLSANFRVMYFPGGTVRRSLQEPLVTLASGLVQVSIAGTWKCFFSLARANLGSTGWHAEK